MQIEQQFLLAMVLEKFDVSLPSNSFYSSGRDLVFFFFNFTTKYNFVNKEDKDDDIYKCLKALKYSSLKNLGV